MKGLFQVLCLALLSARATLTQKNADEGRPYEFGFTIDGQQHRHEKKDERGIIQGEFGFITADGIYHVTVYATDENGRFKILKTRNLRISAPLDGSSFKGEISPEANKYRKQANLPPLPAVQASPNALSIAESPAPLQQAVTTPRTPIRFTTQPTIKPACAGCGYVTTKKPLPGQSPFTFQKQEQINSAPFGGSQSNQPLPGQYDNTAAISLTGQLPNRNQQQFQQPPSIGQQNLEAGPGGLPNYVAGAAAPNLQNPSNGPQSNIPQYQAAGGPQNTNYRPFGGVATGQLPAGGTGGGNQEQILENNKSQYSGGTDNQNQIRPNGQYNGGESGGSVGGVGFNSYEGNGPLGGLADGKNRGGNNGANNDGNAYNKVGGNEAYYAPNAAGAGGQGNIGFGGEANGFGQGNVNQRPEANPLQIPGQGPAPGVSSFPPVSLSDNVIHVGGDRNQDIPIRDKFPGMQDGLPTGIKETDITDLLYKFNYKVGFHGHYEKGLKDGSKIGGYFVNGRDGISRVVTYIADENGYRPKVKLINLGLDSEETPKADTEKTFGLKSFEFVWYPI